MKKIIILIALLLQVFVYGFAQDTTDCVFTSNMLVKPVDSMKHMKVVVPKNFKWEDNERLLWQLFYEGPEKESSNHFQYLWGGFKVKKDVWTTNYQLIDKDDVYFYDENMSIQFGDWHVNVRAIITIILFVIVLFIEALYKKKYNVIRYLLVSTKVFVISIIILYQQELFLAMLALVVSALLVGGLMIYTKNKLFQLSTIQYWTLMFLLSSWMQVSHIIHYGRSLLLYDMIVILISILGFVISYIKAIKNPIEEV